MNDRDELDLKCLCGRCGMKFVLACDRGPEDVGEDGTRYSSVRFRSCESGGIYAATVECPWCGNQHDLV